MYEFSWTPDLYYNIKNNGMGLLFLFYPISCTMSWPISCPIFVRFVSSCPISLLFDVRFIVRFLVRFHIRFYVHSTNLEKFTWLFCGTIWLLIRTIRGTIWLWNEMTVNRDFLSYLLSEPYCSHKKRWFRRDFFKRGKPRHFLQSLLVTCDYPSSFSAQFLLSPGLLYWR